MPPTERMTIRVSAETKQKLVELAALTGRSMSALAAEAVQRYCEREIERLDGKSRRSE